MNTPNATHDHPRSPFGKGNRPDRTQRAAFWLRAIDVRKHELTREYRRSLRDRAREGVSDEEYAAMLGTLEKMARNLGWDESQQHEQSFGRGRRHGFGRGHRHPAMMHGFGSRRGHAHHGDAHHDHDHDHGRRPAGGVATDTPQA